MAKANAYAVFSWTPFGIGILVAIYTMFTQKKDKFAIYHAKQAVVFGIAMIIVNVLPVVGWIISLLGLFYTIYNMYRAYKNEKFKVPFIGEMAEGLEF